MQLSQQQATAPDPSGATGSLLSSSTQRRLGDFKHQNMNPSEKVVDAFIKGVPKMNRNCARAVFEKCGNMATVVQKVAD